VQLSSTVIRGEVNGRRAEVRLDNGVVRIQVLTVVSQQPALDLAAPVQRLLVFRIRSRPQWLFGGALFALGIYSLYFASGVPLEIRETAAASFAVLGAVGLGLGFLFPVISLHIADPDQYRGCKALTILTIGAQPVSYERFVQQIQRSGRLRPNLSLHRTRFARR